MCVISIYKLFLVCTVYSFIICKHILDATTATPVVGCPRCKGVVFPNKYMYILINQTVFFLVLRDSSGRIKSVII